MKVILLQNIKGFGQIGDLKNVSDGHARNFLIPRRLAKPATDRSEKEAEQLKSKREAIKMEGTEKILEAAEKLKDIVLIFNKKASKTGTLFSSITKEEIAKEASKISGYKISEEMIDLGEHGEHIKKIGEHMISIHLTNNKSTEIKVIVNTNKE